MFQWLLGQALHKVSNSIFPTSQGDRISFPYFPCESRRLGNMLKVTQQSLVLDPSLCYLFYFCHWNMVLQSSFYILSLKDHKHMKLINNFLCFLNSPASTHTSPHNPESSQTILVKTTKVYTCSYLHSKVPPTPFPNQNVTELCSQFLGSFSLEGRVGMLTPLAVVADSWKAIFEGLKKKEILANVRQSS